MPDLVTESLADQALDNLVNQFARPLDFLRELVQNAIDAGSPRVEVELSRHPSAAGKVVEIAVQDFGDGMDEAIIDEELTRLFASSKENDLTRIGKFGIGFTSVFAVEPEAVIVRTGRHGEAWELLFHPDRSFDKVRLDTLVRGTRVTLFKELPHDAVDAFVRECRWILSFWCEHSNTPIQLIDTVPEPARASSDDPFAAFEAPTSRPETINRPLALEAPMSLASSEDGVELSIGFGSLPRYGFYNGGLTLLNTTNTDVLGHYAPRLAHYAFKLKCDALEHTLTRDNVLQDEHWERAMGVLVRAAGRLELRTARSVQARLEAGDSVDLHLALLAKAPLTQPTLRKALALPDRHGRPWPLDDVLKQARREGAALVARGSDDLLGALEASSRRLLPTSPDIRRIVVSAQVGRAQNTADASEVWVLPRIVPDDQLSQEERALLQGTRALLTDVGRLHVVIGAFDTDEDALVLQGPPDGGLFRRARRKRWFERSTLLLHRAHPHLLALLAAAEQDRQLAALALAQALLYADGSASDRNLTKLLEAVA